MRFASAPRALAGPERWASLRLALVLGLVGLLLFSVYGTLAPSRVRCGLPGAVGCPGGVLGPEMTPVTAGEQFFTVTMYDWGFWIVDATTGANETNSWNVFEGWTVHINATSLKPNSAIGGTAYHGLGIELNATGQQLLSLAAPVGQWTPGSFVAPNAVYHHQHIWCTISCGPGHGGQQAWVLNVIPPVPLPKATATSNVSSGAAPLAVELTGVPSAGTPPYNTSWDFGDGSAIRYGLAANHTYTLGGNYSARFQVTDAKGMVALATVNVLVNSSAGLSAVVTASPSSGIAPFGTELSAVAHGGAPPYAFTWTFGDGPNVSGPNLTRHLYSAAGVYAVVVTVRDAAGATTRALASVSALPPLGYFPVSVSATPPSGSAPIVVQFNATPGGGTGPYTFLWVLGDGSTATGASVAHAYNLSGSYEINVFVDDAQGRVGTAAVNVPLLVANTSGGGDDGGGDSVAGAAGTPSATGASLTIYPLTTPNDGGTPLLVNASASVQGGTGTGVTVQWNFGDGTTGTGPRVAHQFAAVGVYNVSVTTTDSGANAGANWTLVRVEPLELSVAVNRSGSDAPLSLTAAATILGGTGRFGQVTWAWGDGTTSTGDLGNHTYPATLPGPFTIVGTTTDSSGAPVSGSLVVTVLPLLTAAISVVLPGSSAPPATVGLVVHVAGGSGGYLATPLWTFGDGGSTRAAGSTNHTYAKFGSYHVTVQTNDSAGNSVVASAWVNLSGAPASGGPGAGGPAPWSFTGVSDPNRAALILMGVVAASGLGLLYRRRGKQPPANPARRATVSPRAAGARAPAATSAR